VRRRNLILVPRPLPPGAARCASRILDHDVWRRRRMF
jgi:hypothetical protein